MCACATSRQLLYTVQGKVCTVCRATHLAAPPVLHAELLPLPASALADVRQPHHRLSGLPPTGCTAQPAHHMPAAACRSQHSAARLVPEQAAAAQPLTPAAAVLFAGWQLMQMRCPAVLPARWLGQHWLVLQTEALPPDLQQAHQVTCRLWSYRCLMQVANKDHCSNGVGSLRLRCADWMLQSNFILQRVKHLGTLEQVARRSRHHSHHSVFTMASCALPWLRLTKTRLET